MPLMNVFEPLFLLLAMIAIGTVLTAVILAAFGRWRRALRLLWRLAIGAAVYLTIVILVSRFARPREYQLHDPRCFDDWCITVNGAMRHPSPPFQGSNIMVSLRLTNRARGTSMGEKGTVVYLVDEDDHRYDPLRDPMAFPFEEKLAPGNSVTTFRYFNVPDDGRRVGLVYAHEGGFPIELLIIGEGGWFQQPPIVWLN
jgi:hypothetical protein